MLYAILSMVFAGFTAVLAKFGMKNISSDVALVIRTSVVLLLVLLNVAFFQKTYHEFKTITQLNLMFLCLSGFTTAVSWVCYYRAMKTGPVSYIASIDKASILVTLLLSFLFLKEPFSAKVLLGAAFILVGLVILVWK